MLFRVIEVGINQKPICDFLLVININLHPISYRFKVITFGQHWLFTHKISQD